MAGRFRYSPKSTEVAAYRVIDIVTPRPKAKVVLPLPGQGRTEAEPWSAERPPMWRAPALQAALIQGLVALPVLAGMYLLTRAHYAMPLYGAALLQGILAAGLTCVWGLAPWWRPIALLFPVALLGANGLHLPPAALLGAFLFLVLLFWSTFRTQVPFYPSGPAVWRAVAELVKAQRPLRLIDIGSGLGGLVLHLARRYPGSRFSGIEMAPLPWLVSVVRARATGSAAHFVRGDYERLNFADYDVVFAYLSPAAMTALWRKAQAEMRPATMLVSFEFGIPDKTPDMTIATTPAGPALYVWHF